MISGVSHFLKVSRFPSYLVYMHIFLKCKGAGTLDSFNLLCPGSSTNMSYFGVNFFKECVYSLKDLSLLFWTTFPIRSTLSIDFKVFLFTLSTFQSVSQLLHKLAYLFDIPPIIKLKLIITERSRTVKLLQAQKNTHVHN